MLFSLRHQIVGPFLVLVVFIGVVGTGVAMSQFASATAAEFNGTLLRAGMLANDHLALLEAQRLAQLRAASDTIGVPEAVSALKGDALERLLSPIGANAPPAALTMRVVTPGGRELLALRRTGTGAPVRFSDGLDYSTEPSVRSALAGIGDAYGDKYLFLGWEPQGPILYWTGPIRSDAGTVVGAILLGEPLADIAEGIRELRASELTLYNPAGEVLQSSLSSMPALRPEVRQALAQDHPVRATVGVDGHTFGLLASDWKMRGRQLGYMAVGLNADGLNASLRQIRLFLVTLFAAAAIVALLLGVALARSITRPVDQLVASMRAVTSGDLARRAPPGPANEVGFLSEAFNKMASALQQKTQQLEDAYFSSLEALARAIDARDPFTFEHSLRVAIISLEIADALKLPSAELEALRRSALLHDIGKIGVEDRILSKPGPLNEEEWAAIRSHPDIGYAMLKGVPFLETSLEGPRHHHERWDGEGYPDHLKGEAISLQARIVSVADAYDAMTSERAYRKGFSFEFAVRAIRAGAGSQFDPVVAAAFDARADSINARLREMRKAPLHHVVEVSLREEAA